MLTLLITGGGVPERLETAFKNKTNDSLILNGQTESITIEQVRAFQKNFSLSLGEGNLTHFILEAQNLTLPSQHALLKTIEEIPDHYQLIITADKSASLIPTILSRCQIKRLTSTQSAPNDHQSQQILQTIVRSNFGQLINLASQISQNDPQKTLADIILTLENSLHQKPNLKRAQVTQLTQTCLNDLQANLNPLLALEHYLVEVRRLML